jgi:isoquinoline 1-oxidoreductase beta subunit
MNRITSTRRTLLKGAAATAAGLIIGLKLDSRHAVGAEVTTLAPNAFVRVAPDNTITLISKHTEIGQGVFTGLPTILAEEMDADWSQMRVEMAPADVTLFAHFVLRGQQATGGSLSISNSWVQLRKAGATARAMLVSAAAAQWKVPADTLTVEKGVVRHAASNRSLKYGDLAAKAAALPVPADAPLKDAKDFKLFGTHLPRLDSAAKTDGTAQFTMDVRLPGMLTALVAHAPRFGGKVQSFDDSVTRKVSGVVNVVQIPTGVAVVAKSFWAAKKGRDALKVTWDDSKAEKRSSAAIMAEYKELAATAGKSAKTTGDVPKAMAAAAKKLSATYEFPYLAHATMEPMDCVVKLTPTTCEMWSGTQNQTADQKAAEAITGIPFAQVKINTQFAGGGFGRRGPYNTDFANDAVATAKAMGADGVPIKLIWTRDDDMRGGNYRPMVFHTIEVGIDPEGAPVAWQHRIVGQSGLTSGAANTPYAIPNLNVEAHTAQSPLPTQPWRAVDNTHTAYVVETFIDEIAHASGQDPVAFRRTLLEGKARYLGVLNLAAEKAGWGEKLPPGKGRGVALHNTFGTYVAQVADVTVAADGKIKVDRIVCAVDCGLALNPDVVTSQVEGGIAFGLGSILHGQITLKDGRVEQSNFHDYKVLRMSEMPKVEVHIVPSKETPIGIGEPPVPPVGPAVANAVFAATGKRLRVLPLQKV